MDEYFVPKYGLELEPYIRSGDITGVHHLIRYLWAIKAIIDLDSVNTILDIACGSGYGSYLIAKNNPSKRIIGIDYDRGAIRHAQRNYILPNLEFKIGNITRWGETLDKTIFDCMMCFDVIEHIEHREIVMEGLVEHLNERGYLLFSTPCGSSPNKLQTRWGHHRLKYSRASLYDFLKRYFTIVIRPDGPDFPHPEAFDCLAGTGISYLLRLNPVVCCGPIIVDNPYK